MRNTLLAAAAAAAIFATPAMARDGSPYVGVEAGILIPEDLDQDVRLTDGAFTNDSNDAFTIDFKKGLDADLIAGYDFGMFRVEGELGYKRARIDGVRVTPGFGADFGLADEDFDGSGSAKVLSLMANALLDIGDENGWSGFVGVGGGRARVRLGGARDGAFAYQGIAGIRRALSPNIDVGLKYRYFRTGNVEFNDDFSDGADFFAVSSSGKLRTHSLLASLVYNFAAPAPVIVEPVIAPPAPVEVAPATQTCPDGSVILATDVCPAPPMPAPAPERG